MYLLDTDFILNYFNGVRRNVELFTKALNESESKIYISTITTYELICGCYSSTNFEKNYALYKNFIKSVEIVDFDEESAMIAGRLYSKLRKSGRLIEDTDIMIAAICIKNSCALLTDNIKHFKEIDELKLIK